MNMLTDEQIKQSIKDIWSEYPDAQTISLIAMCIMVNQNNNIKPEDERAHNERIRKYMLANCDIRKGVHGGMLNPGKGVTKEEVTSLIAGIKQAPTYEQLVASLPAINNHTCPSCKNDKVSKSEKSCWKCGGVL